MDVIITTSTRALECYAVGGSSTPLAVVNRTVAGNGYGNKDDARLAGAVSLAGEVQQLIDTGAGKLLMQIRTPLTVTQSEHGWEFRYRVGLVDITGLEVDATALEPKI